MATTNLGEVGLRLRVEMTDIFAGQEGEGGRREKKRGLVQPYDSSSPVI